MPDIIQSSVSAPKLADAVLEGGGVRGIGHVGALEEAEQLGYQWVNIAGTSAGAIVAAILASGYNAAEMREIMSSLDYKRFADNDNFDWFFAKKLFNILVRGGVHPGKYIEDFLREKLRVKDKLKFGDLVIAGQENQPKNSVFRYRLTVIVSDITLGRMVRLPQDAQSCYGLDPDEVDIARAVHMSASIPFFFIPVNQQYTDGSTCRIVDGGLLSNFPLSIFDVTNQEPTRPTFGLRLVDQSSSDASAPSVSFTPTRNAYEITQALIHTMLTAHDRLYMDDHTYVRTIAIPTDGISATRFDLSTEEAQKLYQNGQEAAKDFFASWDFAAYKAAYRSGQSIPGRQERLHMEMKNMQAITRPLPRAS